MAKRKGPKIQKRKAAKKLAIKKQKVKGKSKTKRAKKARKVTKKVSKKKKQRRSLSKNRKNVDSPLGHPSPAISGSEDNDDFSVEADAAEAIDPDVETAEEVLDEDVADEEGYF